jgi:hypothetical protein
VGGGLGRHRDAADAAADGPGIALLIAAPLLILWIGATHGWWWAAFGLFAFLSMFRNPLRYFIGRAVGRPMELPPELRDRQG